MDHELTFKKFHTVIEFNESASFKPHLDINTELKIKAKHDFEKDFFNSINNLKFQKTRENVRKPWDIILVTNDMKRSRLVVEPNYHTKQNGFEKSYWQ